MAYQQKLAPQNKQSDALKHSILDTTHHTQAVKSEMTDFVKFMVRRELVNTGLTKFDDHPENYRSWRSSFKNLINDLNISASEELDLLAKWLGSKSSEYMKTFRSVNANDPSIGLKLVWERLEECYGNPVVIVEALLNKARNFPKISNTDNQKLRELGDLLIELVGKN